MEQLNLKAGDGSDLALGQINILQQASFDGCSLNMTIKESGNDTNGYRIPLGQVDPDKFSTKKISAGLFRGDRTAITIECSRAFLRGQRSSNSCMDVDPGGKGWAIAGEGWYFYAIEASRTINALRTAAISCGAKASRF